MSPAKIELDVFLRANDLSGAFGFLCCILQVLAYVVLPRSLRVGLYQEIRLLFSGDNGGSSACSIA